MARRPDTLWRNEDGAVAAIYSIALMGLIAVAGVGYDYARLASVDSELQNAADQAALAAATQLDKADDSCARASAAAVGLLRNTTMLANDGGGNTINITAEAGCDATGRIRFYQDRAKTQEATTGAEARFVEVHINPRQAVYALTPVVAALRSSGPLNARAFAGIGSAICRTPPVMMCNPAEPDTNTDPYLDFDVEGNIGTGFLLIANDSMMPGAFGWLETGSGNSASDLLAALSWDVRAGDCVATDGVQIKEGMTTSVLDGIGVRFDLPGTGTYCPDVSLTPGTRISGTCSPSVSVRKDQVRTAGSSNWSTHLGTATNFWTEAYRPTSAATYDAIWGSGTTPRIMGHPRDLCHAWSNTGNCSSFNGGLNPRIGTGDWDINAYWRSNFGSNYGGEVDASTYGPQPKGYPTRYQVYRWEADNIVNGTFASSDIIKSAGGGRNAYAQPQAGRSLALADAPYGLVPGSDLDRRRISVAMLNCNAVEEMDASAHDPLPVATWLEVFLVEPPIRRTQCQGGGGVCNNLYTERHDVYVELISRTDIGGDNGSVSQTIRRDVPYLIE